MTHTLAAAAMTWPQVTDDALNVLRILGIVALALLAWSKL